MGSDDDDCLIVEMESLNVNTSTNTADTESITFQEPPCKRSFIPLPQVSSCEPSSLLQICNGSIAGGRDWGDGNQEGCVLRQEGGYPGA